ncbi:MAG: hypothetical protein JNL74_00415 [Fibrobacteres bacterium]|nr:hypothetical protein [Fibrobacterota bacterium]
MLNEGLKIIEHLVDTDVKNKLIHFFSNPTTRAKIGKMLEDSSVTIKISDIEIPIFTSANLIEILDFLKVNQKELS